MVCANTALTVIHFPGHDLSVRSPCQKGWPEAQTFVRSALLGTAVMMVAARLEIAALCEWQRHGNLGTSTQCYSTKDTHTFSICTSADI